MPFDQTPPPGAVVARLDTPMGVRVPLVQVTPAPFGHAKLTDVNQQVATVCGHLLFHDGRLALDVTYVSPGANTITPGVSSLALVVLALLGLLPVVDGT